MDVPLINLHVVLSALVFAIMGIGIFAIGFWTFDRATPYHLWKEIVEKQNNALAIVVAAVAISIGLIISAAIQG